MLKTEMWKNVFYGNFVKNIWNKFELNLRKPKKNRQQVFEKF